MLPAQRIFRYLVLLDICSFILSFALSSVETSLLPEELQNFVNKQNKEIADNGNPVLVIPWFCLLGLSLISTIGLYRFWRPARNLYLFSIVAVYILAPFYGPVVQSGISATFGDVGNMLSGVLMTLAFTSPLKDLFDNPGKPLPTIPPPTQPL